MSQQRTKTSGNLTIRQLEVFAVAARSSTFSEAARRLQISQPTLSNMIAKMEEQLNLSLFDRTTRTLALTAEGERLSKMAQELVHDFKASLRSIQDMSGKRHGRLAMAVLPSVASAIAPAAIQKFLEQYPEFEIALHDTNRQDGLVGVLDRTVDFGILTSPPKLSELRAEVIHSDPFQIVCHTSKATAFGKGYRLRDLAHEQIILTGTQQIRRDVESRFAQANVTIAPRFEVENILTGLSLVSANLGVTVLPGLYLPAAMTPTLVALPIRGDSFSRTIEMVHRADRAVSEPVAHMIDCFRQAFSTYRAEN